MMGVFRKPSRYVSYFPPGNSNSYVGKINRALKSGSSAGFDSKREESSH